MFVIVLTIRVRGEDSDWRLENGLGEAKRDQIDGSKGALGIEVGGWWGIRGLDHVTN